MVQHLINALRTLGPCRYLIQKPSSMSFIHSINMCVCAASKYVPIFIHCFSSFIIVTWWERVVIFEYVSRLFDDYLTNLSKVSLKMYLPYITYTPLLKWRVQCWIFFRNWHRGSDRTRHWWTTGDGRVWKHWGKMLSFSIILSINHAYIYSLLDLIY